jgi:hypothetical protein
MRRVIDASKGVFARAGLDPADGIKNVTLTS